jgi:polyhydroxyalkanoate synthesis repressor PhaR
MMVKKYPNRRLYDTSESRYITQQELADRIRAGSDVHIVDARTGKDLTQATLTQMILEEHAALLPVTLLMQLLRMDDDALAEFLGRYVSWAMEIYLQAKLASKAASSFNPFATVPFSSTNALARTLLGTPWLEPSQPPIPTQAPASATPPIASEVAQLRREIDALKASIGTKHRKK